MYHIYFDGNEGDDQDRFDLGIPGSLRDIEKLSGELTEGMHVILYDDEELEVEAVLEFNPKHKIWMGRPLWDTLRRFDVDETLAAGAK
jgi:hypothetical protein